jgi:hypothetical protein
MPQNVPSIYLFFCHFQLLILLFLVFVLFNAGHVGTE